MQQLKLALHFIKKYQYAEGIIDYDRIQIAMKEYAEQFIDEAAERATTTEDPWGLGVDIDVDKESILELKLDLK